MGTLTTSDDLEEKLQYFMLTCMILDKAEYCMKPECT